jgi:hypothetical protein
MLSPPCSRRSLEYPVTAQSVLGGVWLACHEGNADVVHWLIQAGQLDAEDLVSDGNRAVRWAAANNHLPLARWLVDTFPPLGECNLGRMNNNQMIRTACRLGHLEVAKWVTETYHLHKWDARVMDDYALCYACEGGHADVVEWLIDRFELQPEDAVGCAYLARRNGHSLLADRVAAFVARA